MNTPLWVRELAAAFWEEAGEPEPFPRSLRDAITLTSFDLTIEELPDLSTRWVRRHLVRLGWNWYDAAPERPLRACLAAENGGGWIYLDAWDSPAERTYSLAHELAHFLRHYWQPRQRAARASGSDALAVLDALRVPTPRERLQAMLHNVSFDTYTHLMRRPSGILCLDVSQAEQEADRLAFELLAPADEVSKHLQTAGEEKVEVILCDVFGLPAPSAKTYAELLFPLAKTSHSPNK